MVRYLAAATVIVLVVLIIVTGIRGGFFGTGGRTRYVSARRSAAPERLPRTFESAPPLAGNAPWALSSLPECFTQTLRVRGSRTYVNARSGARFGAAPQMIEIPVGSTVRSADCTALRRRWNEVDVRRGGDVALTVAPVVEFQTDAPLAGAPRVRALVLLVRTGDVFVLRRYSTQSDATIVR